MVGGGFSLMLVGVAVSIISFFLKTAAYETSTNNLGLMQTQQNVLLIGLTLFISGMVLMCSGFIKEAVEKNQKP